MNELVGLASELADPHEKQINAGREDDMIVQNRDQAKTSWVNGNARAIARGVTAGLAVALFVGAGSAQAGDDFEAGFEYEIGRIAAHSVAAIGHAILVGPPRVTVVEHRVAHRHVRGCRHDRHVRQPNRHVRKHVRHAHKNGRHARVHRRHGDRYYTNLHVHQRNHKKGHAVKHRERRVERTRYLVEHRDARARDRSGHRDRRSDGRKGRYDS